MRTKAAADRWKIEDERAVLRAGSLLLALGPFFPRYMCLRTKLTALTPCMTNCLRLQPGGSWQVSRQTVGSSTNA